MKSLLLKIFLGFLMIPLVATAASRSTQDVTLNIINNTQQNLFFADVAQKRSIVTSWAPFALRIDKGDSKSVTLTLNLSEITKDTSRNTFNIIFSPTNRQGDKICQMRVICNTVGSTCETSGSSIDDVRSICPDGISLKYATL